MHLPRMFAAGFLAVLFSGPVQALNSLSLQLNNYPSQPQSGQVLTYQVQWQAGTGSPCIGDLVLNLPASGTTFQGSNPGGSYEAGNNRVVWPGVRFHNNTGSRWVRVIVEAGATSLSADAQVSGGCSASVNPPQTPVDGGAMPIIELDKTASKSSASAGEQITYTLSYRNSGTAAASGVVLTDELPSETSFVSATNNGMNSASSVTWNLGTLAAGSRGSVTVTAVVDSPVVNGTVMQNFARIDSDQTSVLDVGPVEVTATSAPELTISKQAPSTHVSAGQQFSYIIDYRNVGADTATGVVVTDSLPNGLNFISASGGGTENNGVVTWNLPDIPPGISNQLILTVEVDSPITNGTVLSNDLNIDSNETNLVSASTVDVTADSSPVLELTKAVSKTTANAGDILTYTLSWLNTGSDAATNVQLQDVLPDKTSFSNATGSPTVNGQQIDWNIGTVAAGAAGSVSVSAQIESPISDGTVLHNTSSIESTEVTIPATAFADTTVSSAPRLAVSKSVSRKLARAGETLVYTISYRNLGTDEATAVILEDHLPDQVNFISASGNYLESNGIIKWDKGTLPAGSAGSVSVTVTVDSPIANGTILHNSVTIDSNETAPIAADVSKSDVLVSSEAVLAIDLVPSKTQANPGETIVYHLNYSNTGTDLAGNAQVVLGLPPHVTLVSSSSGSISSGNGVVWNVGNLVSGASGTVTATVSIDSPLANGTRLSATASISDILNHFASATAQTLISSAPRLEISKTVSKPVANPGDTLVYTLHYQNSGTDSASNVVLEDLIPAELTFVSASANGTETSGVVDWNIGELTAGSGGSVSLTARINSPLPNGTVIHNHATLDSDETAPVSTGQVDVLVSSVPRLSISKSASRTTASPGDTVTYTIHYTNSGTDSASAVLIEDHLPPEMSFVRASGAGTESAGVATWSIGDLAAGGTGSVTLTAIIQSPLANGTVLHNTATIESAETTPLSSGNVDVTVSSAPLLTLTKRASASQTAPGRTILYTLNYANSGTDEATGVTIEDHLPPETSFVSATGGGSHANGVVTWDLPSIPAGSNGSVSVKVAVNSPLPNGTVLHNSATLVSNEVPAVSPPVVDVLVTSAPLLTVSKHASRAVASPGDSIVYTLSYSNQGTDQATGVILEDHLPPDVSFVSATAGGAETSGVVNWDIGTVAAGTGGAVSVTATVNSPLTNGTVLHNSATINSVQTSPVSTQLVDVIVNSAPVIEIAKSSSVETISAGSTLVYTISYRNTGSDVATGLVLEDQLPMQTSLVSATPGYTFSGGTVRWDLPELPAGSSGSVNLTVRVESPLPNGFILANSASIDSLETQPVSTTKSVTVSSAPLLGIAAMATPNLVQAGGGQYVLTLDFQNIGNENASGIELMATVPPESSFVSATGGGSVSNGSVTWALPSLAAGESGSVSVTLSIPGAEPDGLVLPHASSISANGVPPLAANLVAVTVLSSPAFELVKIPSAPVVTAGELVSFQINYFNAGTDAATNVSITDTIPVNTSLVSVSANGTDNGDSVSWSIGTVPAQSGGAVNVTLRVLSPLPNGTQISNQAEISSSESPPLSATASFVVSSAPRLQISKFSTPQSFVQAGSQVSYVLEVTNIGNDAANQVVVTDNLPAGASLVAVEQGGQYDPGMHSVTWNIPTLVSGARAELGYSLAVPLDLPDGSSWSNTASAQAQNASPVSNAVTLRVASQPALELSKSGGNSVEGGQNVIYRLDYQNTGNATAQAVVLEDIIPAGMMFVTASGSGAESGGAVTWQLGNLLPGSGGNVSLTLQAPAGPVDGTVYTNTASITAANAATMTDHAVTVERTHVELDVAISGAPSPVAAGNPVNFLVSYANLGNADAPAALVRATLPPNTVFVSADNGGTLVGNTVEWILGNLPALNGGTLSFLVDVDSPLPNGTQLQSTANIEATGALPDSATATVVVSSAPLIVTAKKSDGDVAFTGSDIGFVISIQNLGNETASNVVIVDQLPRPLEAVSASDGGTIDSASNTITWVLGDIEPGDPIINLSLQARVIYFEPEVTNVAVIRTDQSPDMQISVSVPVIDVVKEIPTLNTYMLMLLALLMLMVGLRYAAGSRI